MVTITPQGKCDQFWKVTDTKQVIIVKQQLGYPKKAILKQTPIIYNSV